MILRGCHTEEDAGTAAGSNEDKGADGADGAGTEEKPSSSCNHSMESSTCTDGAGPEKPTDSRTHSAEGSASAMRAEAKPEATPEPLEPTKMVTKTTNLCSRGL